MHQQTLALEFQRPRTRAQMHACMQRSTALAIQQVLDTMFGSEPEAPLELTPATAPKLPTVKPGDAILRINYALLDVDGIAFAQDLDIPLPTFAKLGMLPMAVKTVQAALSTLVLSPLYGAVTDYVEARTAASAHSEVPLPFRLKQSDRDPVTGEPADLEHGHHHG